MDATGPPGDTVSRDLNELHSEMRPMVDLWLGDLHAEGLQELITCTLRSGFDQAALWAKGRTVPGEDVTPLRPMGRIVTNARPGQSAHNFGLAIDFVIMDHGKPVWSGTGPLWDRAIELGMKRGMESLRPFESCHLQHRNWRELAGVDHVKT